jgi:Protein of unknown function (DUF2281)
MFNLPHHIMSTIESIVQELEKIPEPMQLSVLAFIHSLDASATPENHHPSELPPRILGLNRGAMKMSDDFDETLPDEFWLGEE